MIFAGFSTSLLPTKKPPPPTVEQNSVVSVHEMNGFKVFPIIS